jgi:hypothetical protein
MCGLFGYHIKKYDERFTNLVVALSILNEERGDDAYGWTNGKVIFKAGRPITTGFNEIPFRGEKLSVFHTRAGTSGPKDADECAHPWQIGTTIGMHNGAISNHGWLNNKYDRKYKVDSMHMVAHIDEGKNLLEVEFGGVFIYFKDGEGPFMFRNHHRNLEVAKLENDLGIVWSSDWNHLTTGLRMAQLSVKHYYAATKLNTIYTLACPDMLDTHTTIQLGEYNTPQNGKNKRYYPKQSFGAYGDVWDEYEGNGHGLMMERGILGKIIDKVTSHEHEKPKLLTEGSSKTKRLAAFGTWRRLPGDSTNIWVPCFHGSPLPKTEFEEAECGCFINRWYNGATWKTEWRPIGTWDKGSWVNCTHPTIHTNTPQCQCRPKGRQPQAQTQTTS